MLQKNYTKRMDIRKLVKEVREKETVQERLDELRNKFKDKHAVIIAPGPSLKEHSNLEDKLRDREDLVVISIKQAYDKVRTLPGFHVVNTYNFDKVNGYDYYDLDNVLIFYGLSQSYVREQMEKLQMKPHPVDIWVPVLNPPTVSYEQCMHRSGDYSKMLMLSKEPATWWGTSILYEQAIPLALLIGCNKITTIGWDLTTGEHFYSADEVTFKPNAAEVERTAEAIETTGELYKFLKSQDVELRICSTVNQADIIIPRIEINDL